MSYETEAWARVCARQWQDNIHEHTSCTQKLGVKANVALLEIRVAVAPLSAVILRVSPD